MREVYTLRDFPDMRVVRNSPAARANYKRFSVTMTLMQPAYRDDSGVVRPQTETPIEVCLDVDEMGRVIAVLQYALRDSGRMG